MTPLDRRWQFCNAVVPYHYCADECSFPDAFHAAYMGSRGIEEIYSWDTDLDRVEGITRVEP